MIRHFIIALQFLTRIRVSNDFNWTPEGFGKSVKFFPLAGAVIGFCLGVLFLLLHGHLPTNTLSALILISWIFLTGGLHLDGLMDTADGVFSGRERARMLEIMKDSRVGSNGVIAFGVIFILKFALISDLSSAVLPHALFIAPLAARLALVISVVSFPYARPDGMGKAFAEFAGKNTLAVAFFLSAILIIPFGQSAFICAAGGVALAALIASSLNKTLCGLTGDTYGAVTECSEVAVLALFLLVGGDVGGNPFL